MSTLDKAPRPTRTRPLYPALPKLKPATVADVLPDDGPLLDLTVSSKIALS